jgi:hypothetical protein
MLRTHATLPVLGGIAPPLVNRLCRNPWMFGLGRLPGRKLGNASVPVNCASAQQHRTLLFTLADAHQGSSADVEIEHSLSQSPSQT